MMEQDILSHLSGNGVCIVLVNANLMTSFHHQFSTSLCCNKGEQSFQGHYILLVGFDSDRQMVFCHNPTLSHGPTEISIDSFEKARKSYGTDQDIIYIQL